VNRCRLHNGPESLIIIDTGTLREPAKNPADLVPLECPTGLELVLEYSLANDNISAAGVRNQVPSVIGHSHPPMRIGEGGLT
jgi:hypothetical protein